MFILFGNSTFFNAINPMQANINKLNAVNNIRWVGSKPSVKLYTITEATMPVTITRDAMI